MIKKEDIKTMRKAELKELIKPIGNKSATDAINKIISESRNIKIEIARNQKTVFQKEVKLVLDFFGFEY